MLIGDKRNDPEKRLDVPRSTKWSRLINTMPRWCEIATNAQRELSTAFWSRWWKFVLMFSRLIALAKRFPSAVQIVYRGKIKTTCTRICRGIWLCLHRRDFAFIVIFYTTVSMHVHILVQWLRNKFPKQYPATVWDNLQFVIKEATPAVRLKRSILLFNSAQLLVKKPQIRNNERQSSLWHCIKNSFYPRLRSRRRNFFCFAKKNNKNPYLSAGIKARKHAHTKDFDAITSHCIPTSRTGCDDYPRWCTTSRSLRSCSPVGSWNRLSRHESFSICRVTRFNDERAPWLDADYAWWSCARSKVDDLALRAR